MKVFLTGGTGFIGTHIVSALLDAGDSVTVIARDPDAMVEPLRSRVRMVRGELELETVREATRGHDAVVHNALVWRDRDDEIFLDDVRAATAVFRAATDAGVGQILYTSSTAVHKPYAPRMDESMRLAPPDFYGAAKVANEAFLAAFSTTRARCNVIRPGPVIGGPVVPGGRVVTYRFLRDIVDAAREGADIHVTKHVGRQLVAASDLARVYVRVLHSDAHLETWLVVARETITWEEVARRAVELTGSRSRIVVEDAARSDQVFDTTKLERDFGLTLSARATLEADLERLCAR